MAQLQRQIDPVAARRPHTQECHMRVRDLMTPNPATIRPADMLSAAQERMLAGRFRRLPVVDDKGNMVAILADGDLRAHLGHLPVTRVTAAMVEKPVTVLSDAPIETAAELMLQHKIGGLPVIDGDGRLVGIITETDLLRGLLEQLRK
jgi:acetoin utilization protein AcuB